jgi:hypothetical protein
MRGLTSPNMRQAEEIIIPRNGETRGNIDETDGTFAISLTLREMAL